MNLPTEVFGNVIVVHSPEELGREHAGQLAPFVAQLERNFVVLDLDSTESIDSNGLEALLKTQRELRESNGDLKIATTNNSNRKILEITRLDEQLEVFDSVIDAVKSYC
ncbi:MAG: STAS domain-containing protein [Planctomycetes bacterium]|nr:STAS domain-containing protein [Planctomycetota bacterium]